MIVRFFGGYDFDARLTPRARRPMAGYAKGVPMGSRSSRLRRPGKAPTFLVAALKDRFSGNLDRIQIIKGWLDKDGKPQEKIYDVVWGDKDRRRIVQRQADPGRATPWTSRPRRGPTRSAIRSSSAVWKDPDFDPSVRARSTTRASSRSRRPAGRATTPCALESRCRPKCRWSTRRGRGPRPSGTRPPTENVTTNQEEPVPTIDCSASRREPAAVDPEGSAEVPSSVPQRAKER